MHGPWTRSLQALVPADCLSVSVDVTVDGCFGAKEPSYLHYSKAIFVAGGTGLAALLALLRHYQAQRPGCAAHLIFLTPFPEDVHAFADLLSVAVGPMVSLDIFITQVKRREVSAARDGGKRQDHASSPKQVRGRVVTPDYVKLHSSENPLQDETPLQVSLPGPMGKTLYMTCRAWDSGMNLGAEMGVRVLRAS